MICKLTVNQLAISFSIYVYQYDIDHQYFLLKLSNIIIFTRQCRMLNVEQKNAASRNSMRQTACGKHENEQATKKYRNLNKVYRMGYKLSIKKTRTKPSHN